MLPVDVVSCGRSHPSSIAYELGPKCTESTGVPTEWMYELALSSSTAGCSGGCIVDYRSAFVHFASGRFTDASTAFASAAKSLAQASVHQRNSTSFAEEGVAIERPRIHPHLIRLSAACGLICQALDDLGSGTTPVSASREKKRLKDESKSLPKRKGKAE